MNYRKAVDTLGRKNGIKYTYVDGDLWVYTGHMMIRTNEITPPPLIKFEGTSSDSGAAVIRNISHAKRDEAVFTGVTFVKGTYTIMVFLACRDDGTTYPVFVNKKYYDLMGPSQVIAVYGTGGRLDPIYVHTKDCDAFICPVRVYSHDLTRVLDIISPIRDILNGAAPTTNASVDFSSQISVNKEISRSEVDRAIQCLKDNGIDEDEAYPVLQALGFILLDENLFPEAG